MHDSAVSRNAGSKQLLTREGRKYMLNLDVFSSNVRKAIQLIRQEIGEGIDPQLAIRMNARLEELKRTDYEELNRQSIRN